MPGLCDPCGLTAPSWALPATRCVALLPLCASMFSSTINEGQDPPLRVVEQTQGQVHAPSSRKPSRPPENRLPLPLLSSCQSDSAHWPLAPSCSRLLGVCQGGTLGPVLRRAGSRPCVSSSPRGTWHITQQVLALPSGEPRPGRPLTHWAITSKGARKKLRTGESPVGGEVWAQLPTHATLWATESPEPEDNQAFGCESH